VQSVDLIQLRLSKDSLLYAHPAGKCRCEAEKKEVKTMKQLLKQSVKNNGVGPIAAISLSLAAAFTEAAPRNYFYDYAKVTGIEPVYETIVQTIPVEQCWNERVRARHSDYYERRHSATPTLIGALIGGALGNELGHSKRNKQVGVVVGSILGGSVGHDIAHQRKRRHNDQGHVEYRTVERCSVDHERVEEQQLVGYDVSYRYRGNLYTTFMEESPGDKLRVSVNVTPVDF